MSKDFFDQEYDKLQDEQQPDVQADCFDDWTQSYPKKQTKKFRPFVVVATALLLVCCISMGWVLCACFGFAGVFDNFEDKHYSDVSHERDEQKYAEAVIDSLREQGITITEEQRLSALEYATNNAQSAQQSDEEVQREKVLFTVFDYIYNNFLYDQIDPATWDTAIANAGTMLLQTTGDVYSSLMSPTDYYVYVNGSATQSVTVYPGEMFGMTFQYATGIGLHVTGISPDSSAFGVLQEGDYIVKLTDIVNK